MLIPEFLCGVLATIFVELVALVAYGIYLGKKK